MTDEDQQPVDKDYDTVVDNRPQEIEFEGKTYELVLQVTTQSVK